MGIRDLAAMSTICPFCTVSQSATFYAWLAQLYCISLGKYYSNRQSKSLYIYPQRFESLLMGMHRGIQLLYTNAIYCKFGNIGKAYATFCEPVWQVNQWPNSRCRQICNIVIVHKACDWRFYDH